MQVVFLIIIICTVAFPLLTLRQDSESINPAVRRLKVLAAGWFILYYYTMINDCGTRILTPSLLLSALVMLRRVPGRW